MEPNQNPSSAPVQPTVSAPAPAPAPAPQAATNTMPATGPKRFPVGIAVIVVVAIAVFAWGGWLYYQNYLTGTTDGPVQLANATQEKMPEGQLADNVLREFIITSDARITESGFMKGNIGENGAEARIVYAAYRTNRSADELQLALFNHINDSGYNLFRSTPKQADGSYSLLFRNGGDAYVIGIVEADGEREVRISLTRKQNE